MQLAGVVMASTLALSSCFLAPVQLRLPSSSAQLHVAAAREHVLGRQSTLAGWKCSLQDTSTERVQIGTLDVSCMGMGTLNWPLNKQVDADAEASMRACIESGIDLFDTAEAYGFGTSEKLTRSCIDAVGAKSAKVATKFAPVPWRQDASDVVNACKASAERLGVESIDL
eukprot:942564-Rhodomonas_salina.1